MASVNKVILVGNCGKDPEIRYMPNGEAVANFSIATTDNWKDKNGQRQERTEWHNIVIYRKLAEIAGEYLKKGRPVYIEGRLQTRKWQTKEGQDRYTTEIIAEQMQLLGGRDSSNSSGDSGSSTRQQSQRTSDQNQSQNQHSSGGDGSQNFDDYEHDDIPFGTCSFSTDYTNKKLNRNNLLRSSF